MREFDLIRTLTERLRSTRHDITLGMGDDAAIVAPPPGQELVITTDTLIAGRHFPEDTKAADIGYKAIAVNLSDVAAMGAEPAWVTVALALPELDADWCHGFVDGMQAAIGDAPVDIIGGDTTRGDLSVTVTAFGLVPTGTAIRRDGAQPGDRLCVTGTLGDAALGLRLWQDKTTPDTADSRWLHNRLHRPSWRNGEAMRGLAHAALDISDGLLADVSHMLDASGRGARIDVDAIPTSTAFDALCPTAERHVLPLTGGDDYELCIAVPDNRMDALADALGCDLTPIGVIETEPGLRLIDRNGQPLTTGNYTGWDHFQDNRKD